MTLSGYNVGKKSEIYFVVELHHKLESRVVQSRRYLYLHLYFLLGEKYLYLHLC